MRFTVLGGKVIARWNLEKVIGKDGIGLDVLKFKFCVGGVEHDRLESAWHISHMKSYYSRAEEKCKACW